MAMILFILKGILLGLAFGIPIGVVGIMTIQQTAAYGFRRGLSTGMSSAAADFVYGLIAALGISAVTDALLQWQIPIRIGGCILILIYGVLTLRRKVLEEEVSVSEQSSSCLGSFLTAVPIAFSNPVTVLTFTVGFATIGIGRMVPAAALALAAGVFVGGSIWWLLLAGFVSRFRSRMTPDFRRMMNRVSGWVLILLAVVIAGSVLR